ncbi:hypothetical protein [Streptomyces ipomoeae]|uniref:Uncharacterized protein n=1 Tax=Streptomyces ipomoeae 91-03 TaxID=698759 RepID=L1KKC1_9ACTN|nr:hypothetical protein [Streptomyces ipomoeae]EKX61052.1 hypothetical protein STRIP9103_01973 [Streptomyces ipomoeae 91-03]
MGRAGPAYVERKPPHIERNRLTPPLTRPSGCPDPIASRRQPSQPSQPQLHSSQPGISPSIDDITDDI